MKSRPQDQGAGTVTFNADVADAASGSGVAQPGNILFVFTRTATGTYQYRFDSGLTPLSTGATTNSANGNATVVGAQAAGTLTVTTLNNNAAVNARHSWSCTARDTRR